jgi:outer membrane protein assembly factor BamA
VLASVEAAPRPGQAHGRRVQPRRTAKSVLLWIPRGVLWLPARFIEAAAHPAKVVLMVSEKFAVPRRLEDVFFNDARTFGAYPLAFVETGFGLNVGARLIHRNLGGHGERLFARVSFGGLYRQRYEASIGTGRLLGDRFELGASGGYRIVRSARFFGIGNADERGAPDDEELLDPIAMGGVESRYRRDEGTAVVGARIQLARRVRLLLKEDLVWREFSRRKSGSAPDLATVYDPTRVAGYATGQLRAYTEAAVVVDTTSRAGPWVPPSTPSRGWLARMWGGIGIGFLDDPSRWLRGGVDVQRFIDLLGGNRVLRLRALVDAIEGPLDHIVFVDMPALGGPDLLRGYVRERFRGRIAGLASAEYSWPIDRLLGGYLFVDVGRVWTRLPLTGAVPRVGFGGGIVLRSLRAFFARIQLASSIDGGFYLQLQLQPSWHIDDDI